MTELSAQLDALTRAEEQERQPTYAEFCAARDRCEERHQALAELEAYKPPSPRMTAEELRALRMELDAARAADEHTGDLFYDAASGRLWVRSR